MKKFFYLSFAVLTFLLISVSCSDNDDVTPPPTVNPEIAKVIDALKNIDGVDGFAKVLSDNALGLDVGDGNITVFAVKDDSPEPKSTGGSAQENGIGKNNLKRHIIEGLCDLTDFAADSMVVVSVSGDPVAITKVEGKVYINGILLDKTEPVKAGENLIYVVEDVVPAVEIPEQKASFVVYEINEEWVEGKEEKALSDLVKIDFFRYVNGEYVKVAETATNKDGEVVLNHYYADSLFYTVKKENKSPLRDGYLVLGLFTTQGQLDEAPEYKTGTALDEIALGKLRIADINGDNIINEADKVENGYLQLDIKAEKTELVIVSDKYGIEQETEE